MHGAISAGFSAQLPQLSICLHLGVAGNADFAIFYDRELRNRIQRLARKRDSAVDIPRLISEENEDVKRHLKTDREKGRPPTLALFLITIDLAT